MLACFAQASDVADRIGHAAKQAEDSNQIVRAYLLYAAACARDPHNASYCANRDALAPAAKLLTKAQIETADVSTELNALENESDATEPPLQFARRADWERDETLQPIPKLKAVQTTARIRPPRR